MEYTFEISPQDRPIQNYEKLLSQFDCWKDSKREIMLNQILESDKKIELFVEIDNSQKVFYVDCKEGSVFRYKCAVIKSIKFIIKESSVINLQLVIEPLLSGFGLKLTALLKSEYELKLIEETELKDDVSGFYFVIPNQAA